tara:strand:- start:165 stop:902 length:738 start_codon:yes stop_codon:yes gene_type:complete
MVRNSLSVGFLNSCKKYEFNNDNLKNILYKKELIKKPEENKKIKVQEKKEVKKDIFIPEEEDTLFWCYVIYKYGYSEYEIKREKKYTSQTDLKINLVYTLRENKELLKKYKFKKTKLEDNLVNDKKISLDLFLFLIRVNKLNIIYLDENIYFEELNNDMNKKCIIRYDKKEEKYGVMDVSDERLEELKKSKLRILNLSKPIKAISNYKVLELKEICKTLKINIMKTTTKCKTKKELYQLIQEKIN